MESTVRTVIRSVAARGVTAAAVSPSVGSLPKGVLGTMSSHWARSAATGLLSILILTGGAAVVARPGGRTAEDPRAPSVQAQGAAASTRSQQPEKTNAAPARPSAQSPDKTKRPLAIHSRHEGDPQIIFVIPEGSRVREGELICELDSAALKDDRTTQMIATRKADAEAKQAKLTLEVTRDSILEYIEHPTGELRRVATKAAVARADLEMARERLNVTKTGALDGGEGAEVKAAETALREG